MAGLRMSADEICKVIGAGRSTLFRHFKNELANGRAMLKARVAGKFYAALDDGEPWAFQTRCAFNSAGTMEEAAFRSVLMMSAVQNGPRWKSSSSCPARRSRRAMSPAT
jgi:hypothetical protein